VAEVIAETERLIIRQWIKSDRADYIATCNTDAVTANLGGPAKIKDVDRALGRIRTSQEDNGFCFWVVERKSDGAFLGYCGLKRATLPGLALDGEMEIGWRLREDAWGRGYALEAAGAVLEWAWKNLDCNRVVSFTIPSNKSSWRLMERLGMARCPDLDFAHPSFAFDHPLSAHIAYLAARPPAKVQGAAGSP
jgi:RimJ/RimL family protein N-acetyltransferase